MSRLDIITIAIVIACLGALGYLVYKIVSLMNPPEKAETSIQDTYPDASADASTYTDWQSESDSGQVEEDLDDDAFAAADGQKPASSYDASELDETPAPAAEKPAPSKPAPSATTTTPKSATSGSTATASSGGKYMVLAGSFKQRANADAHVASLRKMGFANAEVSMFNRSAYAVVLVDRFDNYSAAKKLVTDLKAKGVDALVQEQN